MRARRCHFLFPSLLNGSVLIISGGGRGREGERMSIDEYNDVVVDVNMACVELFKGGC